MGAEVCGPRVLTRGPRGATWRRAGGHGYFSTHGRAGRGWILKEGYDLRAGGDELPRVRAGREFWRGAKMDRDK